MSARASGCAGTRSANAVEPGACQERHRASGARASAPGVERPGPEARGERCARSIEAASASPRRASATWTMSGLKRGRSFAAKIAATARSLVASAPRP